MQAFDPRSSDHKSITRAIDQAVGAKRIHVEWFDFSLNQEDALRYYLPLIRYAQALGIEVHCTMSKEMSEHLVRYKHLMFVDPLFLRKFKFKTIKFTIPWHRPDLMR